MLYRERGLFLQTLHPVVMCAFTAGTALLALAFSHPLYLAGLLAVCLATLARLYVLKDAAGMFWFCLPIVALILVVNPLVAPEGATVLWRGPSVPVLGTLRVSLEAVGFALAMGLRLLVILTAFLVYSAALNPDRMFNLFSRCVPRAAVVFLLALRVYPTLLEDYTRIREAQTARGVDFEAGSCVSRFSSRLTVARGMLVSSLERVLEIAESMHARGFGCGPRTVYSSECWRPRDWLALAGVLLAVAAGATALISGAAAYNFYPALDAPLRREAVMPLVFLVPALLVPVLLQWGWTRWPWLRSKI